MRLRTPLARVRGLGSAKDGTHHWWAQRLTALALVPLCLWFVAGIVSIVGADYDGATEWIRSPNAAVLLVLFLVAVFYHAQLGMQVVIEDYVHIEWIKVTGLVLVRFAMIVLAFLSLYAVLRVSLGH